MPFLRYRYQPGLQRVPPRSNQSTFPAVNTMKKIIARFNAPVFALAAAAVLAGCATITPATPEAAVQKRAQERVSLMQSREFAKAYAYLTPSYRALNDADSYSKSFGNSASWVDPKVAQVKCPDSDRCLVSVTVGVQVVAPGFGTKPLASTMWETWVLEDGQWWFHKYN